MFCLDKSTDPTLSTSHCVVVFPGLKLVLARHLPRKPLLMRLGIKRLWTDRSELSRIWEHPLHPLLSIRLQLRSHDTGTGAIRLVLTNLLLIWICTFLGSLAKHWFTSIA